MHDDMQRDTRARTWMPLSTICAATYLRSTLAVKASSGSAAGASAPAPLAAALNASLWKALMAASASGSEVLSRL